METRGSQQAWDQQRCCSVSVNARGKGKVGTITLIDLEEGGQEEADKLGAPVGPSVSSLGIGDRVSFRRLQYGFTWCERGPGGSRDSTSLLVSF